MNAIRVAHESVQHDVNRHISEEVARVKSLIGNLSAADGPICSAPRA